MREIFASLRARVLLLIAIPFAVMLSMIFYHALGEREVRLATAKTRVLDAARVIAGEQQRIIEHVHQVLASAALLPEVHRGVASEPCNRALAARLQLESSLNTILLALPNGEVICNAIPTAQRISIADRDFFKAAVQTRGFSEGGYVISRTTGRPGIGFGYPVLDETGVPRSVLATTLSLEWLKQELARAQLPDGARVVIVDGEGLVLGRHPDPEGWIGKSTTDLPLLRSILAKGGEGTEEGIGLDGLRRIFGFVSLHRTASGQAYLWVAILKDAVTKPVEREFVVNLLIALVLLVLTFGAVWMGSESLFVRRIVALTRAANELGKGNLATRVDARANGDEIGQLAQSFNRMADGLQTKETQLSRVVRALRVLTAGNRTMLREEEGEQHLLDEMCRAIGEAGGYHMTWVGYVENDTEKSIRPVTHWGSLAEGYFENIRFSWSETEDGRAPPGRAIRTGVPVVVQNVQSETGPQPWRDYTLRYGCGAYLALPLRMADQVIGVLSICAEETGAFSDEEVELLNEAAADLSFGISSQRTGATLKTAEERFRAAAEANLDALFILKSVRDTAGHIVDFEFTDINAHAEEMLGMVRERVIGQRLCELLPINRTGGFFDKYARVAATGAALEEEFPIDTPEIKAKWLRHQVVRVNDGIAISSRDVTLWKEAGARLRQSEEKYRTVFEESFDGMFITSPEGKILDMNKKGVAMFGYDTKEEMQRLDLERDVYAQPPDRQRILSMVNAQGTAEYEIIVKKKNGEHMTTYCSLTAVKDEKGAIVSYRGIIRDITEKKRAEQALRESVETIRTVSSAAQDAVLMLDNDGNIVFWNPAAERMFGYPIREAMGKELHVLLAPPRFHEAYRSGFNRFRGTGEGPIIGKMIELAALRKDGTEFPMELSLSAVRLKDKWHAVGIVRDITDRKKSEEGLKLFRALIDQSSDAIEVVDPDTLRFLDVNQRACLDLGYSREELLSLSVFDIDPVLDKARAMEITQGLRKSGVKIFESRHRRKDGSEFPVEISLGFVQLDRGYVISAIRDITKRKQDEFALKSANRALRTLSACNEALVRAANESALLNSICELIVETGSYRMAWVGFAERDPAKSVRPVSQYGDNEEYLETAKISWADTEHGRGPTGTAIRTGEIQVNQNFLTNPRMAPWQDAARKRGYQSSIALPLKSSTGILGVLTIYAAEPDAFNEAEVTLLQELADDLAFGIETLRTRAERDRIAYEHLHHAEILRESLEDSIKAIAGTVEMRDPYTAGHQRRVGQLAVAISKELGLPNETIHGIELAASIHDLGKIRVPAEILAKPSRLTDTELTLIQDHAQAGYDILKDIKFPWPIATMVLQHHERLDGSGYPLGLKGDQILSESRIMAVADVVEAMASHRPYRPALGIEPGLNEIKRGRGSVYDPAVVDACLNLFREGRFKFQG